MLSLKKNNIMDFSDAAVQIAQATVSKHADIFLENVHMHPDKTVFLRYAILMGARIHILDQRWVDSQPVSNLRVQHAKHLKAIEIRQEHMELLKNELPLLRMMENA